MPNNNKCKLCERKSRYTFYGKHYCGEHYLDEVFGCRSISALIDKNKIPHIHSAIDNHIILRHRNKDVIEMCMVLGMKLGEDYWFGKGIIGKVDFSDYTHVRGG